jgi:uncharacterized lipoprotein YajG
MSRDMREILFLLGVTFLAGCTTIETAIVKVPKGILIKENKLYVENVLYKKGDGSN